MAKGNIIFDIKILGEKAKKEVKKVTASAQEMGKEFIEENEKINKSLSGVGKKLTIMTGAVAGVGIAFMKTNKDLLIFEKQQSKIQGALKLTDFELKELKEETDAVGVQFGITSDGMARLSSTNATYAKDTKDLTKLNVLASQGASLYALSLGDGSTAMDHAETSQASMVDAILNGSATFYEDARINIPAYAKALQVANGWTDKQVQSLTTGLVPGSNEYTEALHKASTETGRMNGLSEVMGQEMTTIDDNMSEAGRSAQIHAERITELKNEFIDMKLKFAETVGTLLIGFQDLWRESGLFRGVIITLGIVIGVFGALMLANSLILAGQTAYYTAITIGAGAWSVAQTILNGLMGIFAIITSPIGLIIIGIAAAIILIIGVIYLLYTNWDLVWSSIVTIMQNTWTVISTIFMLIYDVIKTIITLILTIVITVFTTIYNVIKTIVMTIYTVISTIFKTIYNVIKTIIMTYITIVKTVFMAIYNTIKSILTTLKTIVSTIWNGIKKVIMIPVNAVKLLVTTAFNGIKTTVIGVFTAISTGVSTVWNGLIAIIKMPINAIIGLINSFIGGLNNIKIPDWVPGVGGKGINIPVIPQLQNGTLSAKGGLTLVGERGPELVNMNKGASVYNTQRTGSILRGSGEQANQGNTYITVNADNSVIPSEFARVVANIVEKDVGGAYGKVY